MRDIGNEETEKLIADLEKKIRREYEQAEKELNEKFNEYVRKFKIKDEIKKQQLARGEITQEFYDYWRKGQFSVAFRWQEMRRTMADDLTTVSQKARSIVDGYRGEAYAINHDYITFLIEKDSGIDTSYTLYNTRSAERLLKGDEVLPRPGKRMKGKIERGEVVKWQEGRIQSVTLQSLLQGESTEHMAQRICRTLSVSNYADAVRYARTAMTGAQNGGRFDAISRCRDEGIDVVGQWSATLDGRTRHTHRQVDGEVAEPGEMFSNGCRFPGDPNGPPAEIWRCRCRLSERVRGYIKDPSDLTRRNTDHMEEDTYEEWKNAKAPKGKKEAGTTTKVTGKEEKQLTFEQKISKIKKDIANNGGVITEAHLKEAGRAVADDFHAYTEPKRIAYEAAKAKADKLAAALDKEYDAMKKERTELMEKISGMKVGSERTALLDRRNDLFRMCRENREKVQKIYESLNVDELRKEYYGTKMGNEEWLMEQLKRVRGIGVGNNDIKVHLKNSRSSVRKYVEEAYSRYPTDWVDKSVARGTLTPRKVDRGYYSDWLGEIAISGWNSRDSYVETAIHELGHRFEHSVPEIKEAEKLFYERRTKGLELEWLGEPYGKDEVSRKDDFLHPYMGKDYGGSAYELVSMGFEMAYQNPLKLAEDKDMQEWIYGILCLL